MQPVDQATMQKTAQLICYASYLFRNNLCSCLQMTRSPIRPSPVLAVTLALMNVKGQPGPSGAGGQERTVLAALHAVLSHHARWAHLGKLIDILQGWQDYKKRYTDAALRTAVFSRAVVRGRPILDDF